MPDKKPEELQENETMPIVRKLNTFTKRVREDIEKKRISEADGQKLILKAAMTISMLTNTNRQTFS
ncbi:MAG: hypothetical protein ABSC57_05315 [Syntrophales bacterium]